MRAWPQRSKPILRGALIIWPGCLPDTISLYPPPPPARPANPTVSWAWQCQQYKDVFNLAGRVLVKRIRRVKKGWIWPQNQFFYVLLSSTQSWEVLQICPVSDRISGSWVSEEGGPDWFISVLLDQTKLIWIKWVFTECQMAAVMKENLAMLFVLEGGWLYTWLGLIIGNNEIHHKFVTTVCSLIVNFAWC